MLINKVKWEKDIKWEGGNVKGGLKAIAGLM